MSDGYRYIPGAYGPHGPFPQAEGGYFPPATRPNPARKVNGISVEEYDPAREQINAQRRAIYESRLKRLRGIDYKQPFRSPSGERLDSACYRSGMRDDVDDARVYAFRAGTRVQQRTGYVERGSQRETKRTRERSRERLQSQSLPQKVRAVQEYEEMLALGRKSYYRVLTHGQRAFVWPMQPGQKMPEKLTLAEAVKRAKFLSERRDPRVTGKYWKP